MQVSARGSVTRPVVARACLHTVSRAPAIRISPSAAFAFRSPTATTLHRPFPLPSLRAAPAAQSSSLLLSPPHSRLFAGGPNVRVRINSFGGPGGTGGPFSPWKIIAIVGGLIAAGSGLVLLAGSLFGPWLFVALGTWWAWRSYQKWRRLFDQQGGSANPHNPFRKGLWTKEARAAQAAQQFNLGSAFTHLSPALQQMMAAAARAQAMRQGQSGAGAFDASAAQTGPSEFLQRKMHATLLSFVRSHPSVHKSMHHAHLPSVPRRIAHEVSEQVSSVNGVPTEVLSVREALDLGHGTIVEARYTLRITRRHRAEIQSEMDEWIAAQTQQIRTPKGITETVLHEPAPFTGTLLADCLQYENVLLRPPGGRPAIDLLADRDDDGFGGGSGRGSKTMEAEYTEIKK